MSIPPVTPVTRAAFFPRPKSSRYFSQQQPTNRRHKMSNNNTDTVTIQENSEDNTATRDVDYGSLALNRGFWTPLIIGGYIAIVIIANIALSS
mgnify:FL=1